MDVTQTVPIRKKKRLRCRGSAAAPGDESSLLYEAGFRGSRELSHRNLAVLVSVDLRQVGLVGVQLRAIQRAVAVLVRSLELCGDGGFASHARGRRLREGRAGDKRERQEGASEKFGHHRCSIGEFLT